MYPPLLTLHPSSAHTPSQAKLIHAGNHPFDVYTPNYQTLVLLVSNSFANLPDAAHSCDFSYVPP